MSTNESSYDSFVYATQALTPSERTRARNRIIMTDYMSGVTVKETASKFKLSERRVQDVIKTMKRDAEDWSISLPKEKMIMIHKYASTEVFNEIRRLKNLRSEIDDKVQQARITKDIIEATANYSSMVAEGETLRRTKEVLEAADSVIRKDKQNKK